MLTAEEIWKNKGGELHFVPPQATIREALEVMAGIGIGSILIMENDELLGIWTERDMAKQCISEDFSMEKTRIEDCMARKLEYTPHTDTVLQLMDKIVGRQQRRLLIKKDDHFIGLLTPGDVMRACLQEKTREIQGLNAMVGWEYYEDWRWTPGQSRDK